MNRHVNAIAGRLSLHSPQRQSLKILARIMEIAPLKKLSFFARLLDAGAITSLNPILLFQIDEKIQ
jgi:hypothetical protein